MGSVGASRYWRRSVGRRVNEHVVDDAHVVDLDWTFHEWLECRDLERVRRRVLPCVVADHCVARLGPTKQCGAVDKLVVRNGGSVSPKPV